jgi:hypothetical protein
MSHFAKLDENNIVVDVVVCDNSMPNEGYDWLIDNLGGRWVKTSYNATIRNKYAAIGDIYNETLDAFIPPRPFASWVLNEETCQWEAPVAYPEGEDNYTWDEASTSWKPLETPAE